MKVTFKTRLASGVVVLFAALMFSAFRGTYLPVPQEYFQIRIYHISQTAQEEKVDAFLRDVYIPAMHRAGIMKVGVFKPVQQDTASFGKRIFVFTPFRTIDQLINLQAVLNNDKVYLEASTVFTDAPYNEPPYDRFENIILKAFINMPQFRAPEFETKPSERVYELRSYESATEAKALKKIEMFNQGGEMAIFEKLGFNAAFYGEVLAGSRMPNLMYMTTFETMASRDEHWAKFREHPDWKVLSGMEEYKNTVSKITIMLLNPTDYSDF